MRFVVYIEVEEDGSVMAHVPSLPGCISTGLSEDLALSRLPQAIMDYLQWLKGHGERVPDWGPGWDRIGIEIGGSGFGDRDRNSVWGSRLRLGLGIGIEIGIRIGEGGGRRCVVALPRLVQGSTARVPKPSGT